MNTKAKTIFWFLFVFLFVLLCAGIWAVFCYAPLGFSKDQAFNVMVAMVVSFGGLLSVLFLAYSTIQTNFIFRESKIPQLLLKVEVVCSDTSQSILEYTNITKNKFHNLKIIPSIYVGDSEARVLEGLLINQRVMMGCDSRRKVFSLSDELKKIGFELEELAKHNKKITLKIKYEFTFAQEKREEEVQSYDWDFHSKTWQIKNEEFCEKQPKGKKLIEQKNSKDDDLNNPSNREHSLLERFEIMYIHKLLPFVMGVMGVVGGGIIWSYLDGLKLNSLFIEVFMNKGTFFLVGLYLALLAYVLIIYAFLYAINTLYIYRKCRFCKKWHFSVFSGVFTLLVLCVLSLLFICNFVLGMLTLVLTFFVLAILFLVKDYSGYLKELKKAEVNQMRGLGLLSFFILITLLCLFVSLEEGTLKRLGFIQKPDDAAWYALDMNYLDSFGFQYNCAECSSSEGSENIQSLVEKLKLVFVEDTESQGQPTYTKQKNTLYGYFIWNVGETRVFCPKSIKIGEVKEKQKDKQNDKQNGKQNLSSCLVINKDKIQLLPRFMETTAKNQD